MVVPAPVFLGMDAGLTSTKAVVIDGSGRTLGRAARPAARREGPGGTSERDLWEQWSGCVAVIAEVLQAAAVPAHRVDALGVSGHGDGLILVDEMGAPVRPGMLSLDTRSRDIVAALESDGRGREMAVETGRPPGSGRPVTLLLWLLANEKASVEAARWILFTKDWIKLRLTGRATTDFSDASAGLLSRSRPEYARPFLEELGLAPVLSKLPELVASAEVAGVISAEAAEATGLRPGIPVSSGSHDASASVIGSGALGADAMCLIAGTWSIDVMVSHQGTVSPPAAARGVHGRWFADGARTTLFSSSPSGAPLLDEWLELVPARLGTDKDLLAGLLGRQYREGGPGHLPTVVPSVRGLGPSQVSGAMVLGLDPAHGPADVAAALAEGIVFRHRLGYELIGGEVPIAEVRTTGGLSRSDSWAQLLADALGTEVVRPVEHAAGAAGAAAMAGVAAGAWPSVDEASRVVGAAGDIFSPSQGRERGLDERYGRYLSGLARLEAF
jgi:L-xylulokinase